MCYPVLYRFRRGNRDQSVCASSAGPLVDRFNLLVPIFRNFCAVFNLLDWLLVACGGWLGEPTLLEGVGEMETAFRLSGGDTWRINRKPNGFGWVDPLNAEVAECSDKLADALMDRNFRNGR